MHYEIKALRTDDSVMVTALSLDAPDEGDAIRQAKNQGYTVLAVRQRQNWQVWKDWHTPNFQLLLFSQELLALLDAGLSLVEAMETLAEKEHRPETKKILERVIGSLYEGYPLSFSIQQFPESFPSLYVATVRASERTGDLSEALARYVAYQMQMDTVRKKVVSASIYPLLLVGAGGLVTLFLMGYVVPKFSHIYEDIGGNIPLFSRLLLYWGKLLEAHGAMILLAFVSMTGSFGYAVTRPITKQWLVQKLWQMPAIGNRMRLYQLARFYRTLGMLLRGGTPIVTALNMAADLLQSSLRLQLQHTSDAIREGRSMSQSMDEHGLTTPVALRMLRVGERTGKMGEMMERIASFYDDEMARWIDWFTKLFEPLLMALIGLFIGIIVVLMYFPIFELAGSIQ